MDVALLITYRITGGDPASSFLFFFLPGCLLAYGATALLLLPAMSLLSRLVALTTLRVSLIGEAAESPEVPD